MGYGVWLTEIESTLIFVVSEMGYGILLLFYGVLSGFVVTVMGYGFCIGLLVGVGPTSVGIHACEKDPARVITII